MEKFSQDLDPFTGVVTQHGFADDKLVIRKDMDLQPLIEQSTAMRNDDDYSKQGIKRGFFHVASVDPITQIDLLKIGVDLFRASPKEILAGLRKLNKDHLITTRKQV